MVSLLILKMNMPTDDEEDCDWTEDQATRALTKAQVKMKQNYDKKNAVLTFEVGDWVSVKRHNTDTKLDH